MIMIEYHNCSLCGAPLRNTFKEICPQCQTSEKMKAKRDADRAYRERKRQPDPLLAHWDQFLYHP